MGHHGGDAALLEVSGEQMLEGTRCKDTYILGSVGLAAQRHCGLELELWVGGVHMGEIDAAASRAESVGDTRSIGVGENGEGQLVIRQVGSQGQDVLTTVLKRRPSLVKWSTKII